MHARVSDLDFLSFSENISRDQYGSVRLRHSHSFGFHVRVVFCRHTLSVLENICGVSTAISTVAVSAVRQWNFAALVKDFKPLSVSVSRESGSCPLCWKKKKKDCCSLYLSLLSAFPSKHSHHYCCCSLSSLACVWRLASLSCARLPFFPWSLPLCHFSFLLLLLLLCSFFKAPSPPTPVNRLLKKLARMPRR